MRHFLSIAICLSVALSSPCSGFAILNGEIGKYHFARRFIYILHYNSPFTYLKDRYIVICTIFFR